MRRSIAIGCLLATTFAAVAGTAAGKPGATEPRGPGGTDYWSAQLRYAGEFGGFRIAAAATAPRDDSLTVDPVFTPTPDLLFVSPGGIAPPPPPCLAASMQVVRCPLDQLEAVLLSMGPGNDEVGVSYSSPTIAGFVFAVNVGTGNDLVETSRFEPRVKAPIRIIMGAGADRWMGGPKPEIWFGGQGNDRAEGAAGKDTFVGGKGKDRMFGGPAVDLFFGGPGFDFARGGAGDDRGFDSGKNDYKD